MKIKIKKLLIVISLITTTAVTFVTSGTSQKQQEKPKTVFALNWQSFGKYKLSKSNSTLTIPSKYQILTSKEGISSFFEFLRLPYDDTCEAIVLTPYNCCIFLRNLKFDYFPLNYWNDSYADNMLEGVIEQIDKENVIRAQLGMSQQRFIRCLEMPVLHKSKNAVHMSIETEENDLHFVTFCVYMFGRYGFELLKCIVLKEAYERVRDEALNAMLTIHSFDNGYRYEDHKEIDKALKSEADLKKVTDANVVKLCAFILVMLGILVHAYRGRFKQNSSI